jgi:hypothetical protein
MSQHLNRPASGIGSAGTTAGAAGKETQSGGKEEGSTTAYLQDRTENDGVLDVAQNSTSAVDNTNDEGSIRQDQAGYEGS